MAEPMLENHTLVTFLRFIERLLSSSAGAFIAVYGAIHYLRQPPRSNASHLEGEVDIKGGVFRFLLKKTGGHIILIITGAALLLAGALNLVRITNNNFLYSAKSDQIRAYLQRIGEIDPATIKPEELKSIVRESGQMIQSLDKIDNGQD